MGKIIFSLFMLLVFGATMPAMAANPPVGQSNQQGCGVQEFVPEAFHARIQAIAQAQACLLQHKGYLEAFIKDELKVSKYEITVKSYRAELILEKINQILKGTEIILGEYHQATGILVKPMRAGREISEKVPGGVINISPLYTYAGDVLGFAHWQHVRAVHFKKTGELLRESKKN